MPKYRVLTKSFIGNRIVEEGEVIDYDGDVADNLELVKPAKKGAQAAQAEQSEQAQGDGESLV